MIAITVGRWPLRLPALRPVDSIRGARELRQSTA